jgi:hypothetical protein
MSSATGESFEEDTANARLSAAFGHRPGCSLGVTGQDTFWVMRHRAIRGRSREDTTIFSRLSIPVLT